jgi:hypothetical protein
MSGNGWLRSKSSDKPATGSPLEMAGKRPRCVSIKSKRRANDRPGGPIEWFVRLKSRRGHEDRWAARIG